MFVFFLFFFLLMMNFSFMLTRVLKITALKKMIFWSSSNALLNNFCSKENDNITCKKKKENFKHSSEF